MEVIISFFFYDDSNKVISSKKVARISSIIEDVSNNLHNEYKDLLEYLMKIHTSIS